MQSLKKTLGLVWMILGLAAIGCMYVAAFKLIDTSSKIDFFKPLPWIIILSIFTPISIGLIVFGYYAWKNEYNSDIK